MKRQTDLIMIQRRTTEKKSFRSKLPRTHREENFNCKFAAALMKGEPPQDPKKTKLIKFAPQEDAEAERKKERAKYDLII
jgi:hypothetical protein